MKYLYYPGCSLKGTGRAYEESWLEVSKALGVELEEIEDWNCCGSTPYMGVDEVKSLALAGRNFALAERQGGMDIIAPCSACYLSLNKTNHVLNDYPELRAKVDSALGSAGLKYSGRIKVRHPLDVILNDVGVDKVKKLVKKPLGLKLAAYYGCQITRPYSDFDDPVRPVSMDKLMEAAGAKPVPYSMKTKCCGGSITGTVPEAALELACSLLKEAVKRGADAMVTPCPLCQFNLDGYQDRISKKYGKTEMPVLYFTQALGLAFGISPEKLGINRCLASAEKILEISR
ncbi:MAG: disulfide reductase [Elusimicrobia bacterium CG08_land_8_20_14_0_20_51_18]|nr:MAG: disulfide reductase [Elusimicrobia bacterium CG08_land_8_20_14_0_20_51_18]